MRLVAAVALASPFISTAPAVAATAKSGEAELASAIGNRQPGKPVDCISPQDQTSVQVIDGTAIVYGYGTRLYVNRLLDGARTLRRDDVLVTHIYGGQLCRLDTVTLLDQPSRLPHGFVTLGSFVPYSRPHR